MTVAEVVLLAMCAWFCLVFIVAGACGLANYKAVYMTVEDDDDENDVPRI